MRRSVVSERYAQALFELAVNNKTVDKLQEEMKGIAGAIKEYPDFRKLIDHPVIDKQSKKDLFEKIFKGKVSDYSLNFIKLLVDKHRETLISEISEAFNDLVNKLHSRVVAEVITAVEVDQKTLDLLRRKLETYLDKKVEVETQVDPGIVGGVLVKIGDRIIDGTLKTRFENMAVSLN